jgi:hypothetical protein
LTSSGDDWSSTSGGMSSTMLSTDEDAPRDDSKLQMLCLHGFLQTGNVRRQAEPVWWGGDVWRSQAREWGHTTAALGHPDTHPRLGATRHTRRSFACASARCESR